MEQPPSSSPIRIGIVGHGNLGRGVEAAVARNPDMRVAGIYTRRDPARLQPLGAGTPVHAMGELAGHGGQLDVLILCGGSKDDLPVQSPQLAAQFCLVDSFDTHARIPEHFAAVDAAAQAGRTTALISAGWDPGMFSLARLMGEALLPDGATYTFWGKGLSQGHSDAIRRVPGVAGGVQYTVPIEEAVQCVRSGERPARRAPRSIVPMLRGAGAAGPGRGRAPPDHGHAALLRPIRHHRALHQRRGAGARARRHAARRLRDPQRQHQRGQPAGHRIPPAAGQQPPSSTASVLVAYARAVHRLHQAGQHGCKTVLDVPPGLPVAAQRGRAARRAAVRRLRRLRQSRPRAPWRRR